MRAPCLRCLAATLLVLGASASAAEPEALPAELPPDETTEEAPPEEVYQEPSAAERRIARRAERQALRRAQWAGTMLPQEADFLRTHVDARLRLGFNGTSASPFSILTALSGWNEIGLQIDAGGFAFRGFTVSFGGTLQIGLSPVLGALLANIANYDDVVFRWSMFETAAVARVAFHLTTLQSMDPYLFAGLGAGAFQISAGVAGSSAPEEVHTSGQFRIEVGGGLNIPLRPPRKLRTRWYVGVELRYLLTVQTDPRDRFVFDVGDRRVVFDFAPEHAPPRGFSWVVGAGYRF